MESSSDFEFNFESSLHSLARCSKLLGKKLSDFVKIKTWQSQEKQALLQLLAELILDEESAIYITKHFKPIIVEVLQRCYHFTQAQEEEFKDASQEKFCYIISILLPIVPHIQSFMLEYLTYIKPFYSRLSKTTGNGSQDNGIVLTITRTAFNLLHHDYDNFIELWDWSPFFKLLDHDNTEIRWLSTHVVAMVTQMSDGNKISMMRNLFTAGQINKMTLEMNRTIPSQLVANDQNCNELSSMVTMEINEVCDNVKFTEDDFTENHVAISGVILPMSPNRPAEIVVNTLVKVPSTQRNLHSLAIAIATGSGVLLEGPVGSGKTCLVEYIAAVTGRTSAPSLMKVQLGDQTDSKSLLGTYICTDTPGEFLWQPGTLLQAVQGGHWVLLEDIDYAPMDVVSVLIPLLESRTLSVPGHGNVVKAAPGFQLFATQRTHSHSGFALHVHSNSSILDRLWTRVNVEPLSKEELSQVISEKFSDLASVSEKLIDVYSMVSTDTRLVSNADISFSSLSHDKRQSTTRDLMKWTSRVLDTPINGLFFVDGKDVFLEAQDCFGATLSKAEQRLELGLAIGAKLGITKEKVEYFCKHYKPKVELSPHALSVGRISLPRNLQNGSKLRQTVSNFAHTRHSLVLLERVAACIKQEEPVLLVGETGTGKTSSVQNLATLCRCTLRVINMSQQSDSSDLLGGFKPVEMKQLVGPVRETFEQLFCVTFSRKQNVKYLSHIQQCFAKGQWEHLFKLMMHSHKAAVDRIAKGKIPAGSDVSSQDLLPKWQALTDKIEQLRKQQKHAESALAFQFVEGTLVKAIRDGDWILLDEINLATPETLECLSGLLESRCGSVVLLERGDIEPIVRHENFRLFACMNPATDVGKKDLPPGIRNRFTEIFVDELDDVNDLKTLVVDYLQGLSPTAAIVDGIVRFYLTARQEASNKLTDGTGHKPHYSLRTLCRALRYASSNPHGNVLRSIYEGFCLSFLTQLDRSSHPVVESLIRTNVLGHVNATSLIKQPLPCPGNKQDQFVNFEGFWINVGEREPNVPTHYVLTESVKANLRDLARVVSGRTFPVLIQGETSVGKTSLIQWLSKSSGNQCVRINNHEHTDIQEYLGCYTSDHDGRLVFKEGVLVDAMRKGYWVILDELNLAPTDVLEALNRLLDDNRELFIAETQETVKAHPNFMLFATQNPPGQYGGRKVLSRAFRNRFVELHFDELPSKELEKILHLRGNIPMSYAKKMVAVLLDLQARRRSSSVFAGKQGFITLRDLFRWAERYSKTPDVPGAFHNWEQHLAEDGYMLLAGRCRNPGECSVIQDVLQVHFKSKLDQETLFTRTTSQSKLPLSSCEILVQATSQLVDGFDHVVWTKSMKRLGMLVGRALQFGEPVLLVGETGCGKTTICQLFAALKQQHLYSVNCHMHSESSDFLGGLRPVRDHHMEEQEGKLQKFFEWCDGPLVLAMKEGAMFLIDEISLADDSVLERLNSVLEPERTLVLAEKGSDGGEVDNEDVDIIVAEEKFRVVATMNPGGDFGKKELSPALRNRFTEIWCPSTNSDQDLIDIIEHNLVPGLAFHDTSTGHSGIGKAMVEFVNWFHSTDFGRRFVVSIRDLLSWVRFINTCCQSSNHMMQDSMTSHDQPPLHPTIAYLHGACLVFLDALGAGFSSLSSAGVSSQEAREQCLEFLKDQVKNLGVDMRELDMKVLSALVTDDVFGIEPFYITRGPLTVSGDLSGSYALNAPTTSHNAQRLLRALQLSRPILLEGSPGVGKTSLVNAIAKASGHELVRINLSEQTDITDLFGADLPVEGGEPGMFTWRDGPLLRALKAGHWIVLDELNLASQSVLEGLNACLDHRAEVYIPELGMSFKVQHEKTRLFACQNPLNQGGGRKGLPKSFLNRFTQVYIEPLSMADLLFITTSLYPSMERDVLHNMITFNNQLHKETVIQAGWGKKGSPWEFNLRDVFRWCDLLLKHKSSSVQDLFHFAKLIYSDRMRMTEDKERVMELLYKTFGHSWSHDNLVVNKPWLNVIPNILQVGYSFLPRKPCVSSSSARSLQVLHHHLPYMESLMKCLEMGWMTILVGHRSCGKTSLVQMVAELTGNKLDVLAMNSSMDTTELLGGFEQANLNHHWQSIITDTKKLVQRALRMVLVKKTRNGSSGNDGQSDSFQLYTKWESFMKSSEADPNTKVQTKKASELTLTKIDQLLVILDNLTNINTQYNCSDFNAGSLKTRAVDLKARLDSNHGNTHCGGQFEWVDGQLVEALKSGYWLLIDNVNFCSPSVLDRLNALLEPGGVLSINERGVIDGEVPSVKPHPDFRLILTMDPSFGEISRAMRNRGVEMFISGEGDGSAGYDDYDLQVMMNGAGLHDERTAQMMLAFHKDYKAKLGGSVLDLLHATTMISDLLNRGENLGTAVMTSMNQVYVRSHVNETERQTAEDLVEIHLNQSLPSSQDESSLAGPPPPSIQEFSENSTLANIKWLCTPLSQLLWKHQSLEYLKYAVDVAMERSTLSDWRLRCEYVVSLLCDFDVRLGTTHSAIVHDLAAMIKSVVTKLFGCSLVDGLRKHYGELPLEQSGIDILADHPYDLRLMRYLHHGLDCGRDTEMETRLSSRCNRLNLYNTRLKHGFSNDTRTTNHKTLLDLSLNFHQELVSKDMLPHPVVAHLFPFFKFFDDFVDVMVLSDLPLNDNKLFEAFESLIWSSRLYNVCTSTDVFSLEQLSLHWQWFIEKTLRVLPHIMGYDTCEFPSNLTTVIKQLSQYLGTDTHLAKIHHQIASNFGHPLAFKSQGVYDKWHKLLQCCRILELSWRQDMTSFEESRLAKQLNFFVNDGTKVKELLCKGVVDVLKNKCLTNDNMLCDSEFHTIVNQVAAIASKSGLSQNRTVATPLSEDANLDESEADVRVSRDSSMKVAILPLYDVIASSQELSIVAELLELLIKSKCTSSKVDFDQDNMFAKLDSLINYLVNNSTRSPLILAVYQCLQSALTQDIVDLQAVIKTVDSELTHSLLANESHRMTSLNVAKWAIMSSYSTHLTSPVEPLDLKNLNLDSFLFGTLTNQSTNQKKSEGSGDSLSSVAIGDYKEKTEQLADLVRHIWSNSDHVTNLTNQNKLCETKLLASKFSQVLLSLAVLIETNDVKGDIVKVAMAISQTHDLSSLKEMVEKMSAEVFDRYTNQTGCSDGIAEMKSLMLQAFNHLTSCVDSRQGNDCETSQTREEKEDIDGGVDDDFTINSGCMWVNLGLLQTLLLCPIGPVDPVEQNAIELQYSRDEVSHAQQELEVRLYADKLWTGSVTTITELEKQLDDGQDPCTLDITSNPLRVRMLAKTLKKAKECEIDLQHNTAVRPSPSQFREILHGIQHYKKTIGNPKTVSHLMSGLHQAISTLIVHHDQQRQAMNAAQNIIHRVETWRASQEKFMHQLKNDFPLYADITGPFVSALAQVVRGMDKLSSCLKCRIQRHMFVLKCPDLLPVKESQIVFPDRLIAMLCNQGYFLGKDNLEMVKCLVSDPTWSCLQGLKSLQSNNDGNDLHSELTSRLLWTSLLYIRNYSIHHNYLNTKAMSTLQEILNMYTQQWTLAKEEEQKREQREGSLFKYKTTTHEGEVDEEKAFENGLCKAFPTFDNEFSEFIQSNSLEEVKEQPKITNTVERNITDAEKFMKNVNIQKVSKVHEMMFADLQHSQTCMLIGGVTEQCSHGDAYDELFQSSYQTAAFVSRLNVQRSCDSIGGYLWEPHLVQSHSMLQRLSPVDDVKGSTSHYDIYHDTNIPEVIKIRPVMTSFSERLDELLAEWPGNPLLTQLQSFIDTILALPVTSPLMKVLTGVELLLKNAQGWENNASRHVSIKHHLDRIINLIIEWRKLELKCWSSLLDVATDNASSKASQWWFYLYSLVQQISTTETQITELIDPLQRFIESSSLGEFSSRMKMLYSFYQQCVALESTMETSNQPNSGKVSDIMLNVHTYYKQFSDNVQQKIQQARGPIEKELKGYVKIAKWNDANFWAMKQATEKSHRTLHKFVRRYEMALSEPVRQLLMNSKIAGTVTQDTVEISRDIKLNPDWFISESSPILDMAVPITMETDHFASNMERLPKLLLKMKKLCRKIVQQQKYPTLISTLDCFTGEIITNVHDLQALDVNKEPKEKRKEVRKHIHLRKRTALAELFKALTSIGLSHKKGIQNSQLLSQESSMMMPAFEETFISSVNHGMSSDFIEATRYHANRCQHYYHRCLARMSALNVHLTSPSKELTLGDIDRCKGYSHHLLTLVQNQRQAIVELINSVSLLRVASRSVTSVNSEDGAAVLPPQDEVPQQMVNFMEFLTWVTQTLQRSQHLTSCCPTQDFPQDSSPVPASMLSAVSTSSSNSDVIQHISRTLQDCQSNVGNLATELRQHAVTMETQISGSDVGNYVIASWGHVKVISKSIQTLKDIGNSIGGLLHYFESSFDSDKGLGTSLLVLTQRIRNECERLESWTENLLQHKTRYESTVCIAETADKVVTSLLLAVQRISKEVETRDDGHDDDEEGEQEGLVKGHLVSHIYQNMINDITKLDLTTVHNNIKSFISELKSPTETNQSPDTHSSIMAKPSITGYRISGLESLLNQFICLSNSYLLSLLTAHQTSCKLLSVLLGVFTELVEKGFCLPPEIEEEESGEGATEFEDIEDGGLGEGEGAKDVSDQIENEDQLQDAKKEGQQEENQDNNQQEIPEEENGIEMSEDFDGALQDVEGEEQDDEKSDEEEQEGEEPDKQMGELDGKEEEKLDEKMWGDSDDEDEKEDKEGESEKGAGAEAETESEMVAKEDNKDAVDKSKEKDQESKEQDDSEEINELPKEDSGNLSDDEVDSRGEGKDEETAENEAEDLDLPEDLALDDGEENQQDGGDDEQEGEGEQEKETETKMDDVDEESMDVDEEGTMEENDENEETEDGDGNQDEHVEQDENDLEEHQEGEEPKDDKDNDDWRTKHDIETQDAAQAMDDVTANDGGSNQNQVKEQTAGQSESTDSQDQQGVGSAMALGNEGHSGEAEVTSAQSSVDTKQKQRKQMNRSRSDRSLGSMDERYHKRLKTVDQTDSPTPPESDVKKTSELYQHLKGDDQTNYDAQTLDSATADQTREQDGGRFPEHQSDHEDEDDDENMDDDDNDAILREKEDDMKQLQQKKSTPRSADSDMTSREETTEDEKNMEMSQEPRDVEQDADRLRSSYHVSKEAFLLDKQELSIDTDKLRSDLEHQLSVWSSLDHGTADEQRLAQSAWHKYELLTSGLAQELCEQLRLVLEPSLATKLKGDYRTGKRLNMRKVIPYIASQFRKDKIWLRRTKPSKREYQVMIAVDDSSSMADNHSKQLAFESLAVISKALTRLEAGDLGVCSFGDTVKLLHPLHEPFTDQSGAKILQQFKFDQKKTKIAKLVSTCSSLMLSSQSRLQSGPRSRGNTSQLLLVVSDGRGVFLEGTETVRKTVRAAKEAGIFLVFVIIDNPINRDSILDIKVPIFRPGKAPEIKSYIEQFPFPFYVILRDINSLPVTLSDALRQWFELVTSLDN